MAVMLVLMPESQCTANLLPTRPNSLFTGYWAEVMQLISALQAGARELNPNRALQPLELRIKPQTGRCGRWSCCKRTMR